MVRVVVPGDKKARTPLDATCICALKTRSPRWRSAADLGSVSSSAGSPFVYTLSPSQTIVVRSGAAATQALAVAITLASAALSAPPSPSNRSSQLGLSSSVTVSKPPRMYSGRRRRSPERYP